MVTPTPPERVTTKNTPLPLASLKTLMSPETINLHGHLLLRLVQLRQQFLGPVLRSCNAAILAASLACERPVGLA